MVMVISSIGSLASATSSVIVNTLRGFPVVQSAVLKSLVASKQVLVIAGVPIAREVALDAGLVAVVVVGGYAYYGLTKKRINKSEVEAVLGRPPVMT
jgi:hypothetical protein